LSGQNPSLVKHFRDILILPFTVTVIVPYVVYNPAQQFIPDVTAIKICGWLIGLSGISLFVFTVSLFRKIGKGTLAPWTPTQKLVVYGPYRHCRNPMITGVFFMLIGESLLFHSTNMLIWSGIFFLINTIYFLLKEEPDLYARFGDEYLAYKRNVPRWIPKLTPYKPA
jgi:protein-S-isoprenylcysteine O-methyltransferase Ste14